jgi:hypothetical protein
VLAATTTSASADVLWGFALLIGAAVWYWVLCPLMDRFDPGGYFNKHPAVNKFQRLSGALFLSLVGIVFLTAAAVHA